MLVSQRVIQANCMRTVIPTWWLSTPTLPDDMRAFVVVARPFPKNQDGRLYWLIWACQLGGPVSPTCCQIPHVFTWSRVRPISSLSKGACIRETLLPFSGVAIPWWPSCWNSNLPFFSIETMALDTFDLVVFCDLLWSKCFVQCLQTVVFPIQSGSKLPNDLKQLAPTISGNRPQPKPSLHSTNPTIESPLEGK